MIMRHVHAVTKTPAPATTTDITGGLPLLIKLNGVVSIVDQLLLAQRQSPWKVHFGPDTDTGTDTTTTL